MGVSRSKNGRPAPAAGPQSAPESAAAESDSSVTKAAAGRLLVTGSSGHLGANLVHRLLADGHSLRVLLRAGSDNSAVDGLPVERVYGDLRDAAAVDAAVKGCQRVYHAAAQLSTLYGDAKLQRSIYDSNVVGTRNILAACLRHGVERAVVTGSFSAVGYDHHDPARPSNEEMRFYPAGGRGRCGAPGRRVPGHDQAQGAGQPQHPGHRDLGRPGRGGGARSGRARGRQQVHHR
ncbi:NAD-dependent epimerase/dehydratase family protein, partial [Haliangium sp. UPWRP_2]|uniref:NAD-dependent epimerase/dehydratase family protein n=1 Tax=Haliangium sp. UPWRP_2 TaxID=1931276 RepID=UPI0013047F54